LIIPIWLRNPLSWYEGAEIGKTKLSKLAAEPELEIKKINFLF
jgi:hypothetical protein